MYMKLSLLILLLVTNGIFGFSQVDYGGTWQGIIIRKGKSMNQSTLIYLEIDFLQRIRPISQANLPLMKHQIF